FFNRPRYLSGEESKMINDISDTEKVYKGKLEYFRRPIFSNTPYKYELVSVVNPYDFSVRIKDDYTAEHATRLKSLMENYSDTLRQDKVGDISRYMSSHGIREMYEGMPVIAKTEPGEGVSSITRGEVLAFDDNKVDVMLVDEGGVVSTVHQKIFPMTVDILRVPVLAVPCRMAYIVPDEPTWPVSVNYKDKFSGGVQIIYFQDLIQSTRSYEAVLEVDGVNVGIQFFHTGVASPVKLPSAPIYELESSGQPQYPLFDYAPWVGLKNMAFGVRTFVTDDKPSLRTRCILQLQPELVNTIQDDISKYVDETPEDIQKTGLKVAPGVCCLARYGGGDYYRAKILKTDCNEAVVDYVDYKEVATIPVNDLIKLPESLLNIPEAANECIITDFVMEACTDLQKLSDNINDKDLYAVIDSTDSNILGNALLVSLFRPIDFSGPDESFCEVFGVSEKPTVNREILQEFQPVSQALVNVFLKSRLPDPNKIYPGAMISVINGWDSMWIQLEEEQVVADRISAELTMFYQNLGSSEEWEFENSLTVGKYVAAQQTDEEGLVWYRAKIVKEDKDQCLLHYIDHGNSEWVKKVEVFPLHTYFIKDHLMTFEVMLKT
ncbi:Tudor domain-containing protein 1, partial [Orchesella cincta]